MEIMTPPRIITFGEIMARLAVPGTRRFQQAIPGTMEATFAGAEANVAVALAHLGGNAAFVTALPPHELADAAVAGMRAQGVDTRHMIRSPEGRLGLFFLEQGLNQRPGQVIYDRAGSSFSLLPHEAYDWEMILTGADWLHLSGITPAISKNAAGVALYAVEAASARGIRVSFDMNYRSKLWQWEPGTPTRELAARTVRKLLPYVNVFFGGRDDIALLMDQPIVLTDHHAAARQLTAEFPNVTHVAATLREALSASRHRLSGTLYCADTGESVLAPQEGGHYEPYDMPHMADCLGGGDAFAAGLIFALTTSELAAPQAAVSFATALSCLAHSIEGDFCVVRRAEVEALMQGGGSGRVNR
jgi:2-dehydro-3-deoxygluconokinase